MYNIIVFCKKIFNNDIHIKINDIWYDVTEFSEIHHGGKNILKKYHNKDATKAFYDIPGHMPYVKVLEQFRIK